jgi:hypothetical protein
MVCSLPHRYAHRVEGGLENSSLIGASLSMWSAHMRARSIAFALFKRRLQLHLRRLGPRPLERQTGPRQPQWTRCAAYAQASPDAGKSRSVAIWNGRRCDARESHAFISFSGSSIARLAIHTSWQPGLGRVRDLIAKRRAQFLTVSRDSPND